MQGISHTRSTLNATAYDVTANLPIEFPSCDMTQVNRNITRCAVNQP